MSLTDQIATLLHKPNFPRAYILPPSLRAPIVPGYCAIPGCRQSGFGRYCGDTHMSWSEKGCILCRKADRWEGSEFCFYCHTTTMSRGPLLVPVPEDNETYGDVANEFKQSWKHPTPCPKVRAIYKVITSRKVLDNYNTHRNQVEVRGRFTSQGLASGNQQRRWHGTDRQCRVGETGCKVPCFSAQCSLCCIIRSSFDIRHAKKKTGWGRFGRGIYTSSASSKANDYSRNLVPSTWKAVLLAYVTIGRAVRCTTDLPSLTEAPWGFDSVVGEPSAAGSLNYDEQVVYTNEAVCPAYLVMYC